MSPAIAARPDAPPSRQPVPSEAEEAGRERAEMLAALAHDLKNPLASIKAWAQLLRRRVAGSDGSRPERLSEGLAQIEAAAAKMAWLIDDLVDASYVRVSLPRPPDGRPTDLVRLVGHLAREYRHASERHWILVQAPATGLVGAWDAQSIERMVANLLSNAIKYSPAGGEIAVELERQDDEGGSWAVMRVRDRGVGIPPADQPHIFEGFHRASNVVGLVSGTGMGLAGVRRIVESHGGRITVESREGHGSTFTVHLPLGPNE